MEEPKRTLANRDAIIYLQGLLDVAANWETSKFSCHRTDMIMKEVK